VKLGLFVQINLKRLYNYDKKIVYSFRIEKAMMRNMLQNVTQEKEILMYKGIIYAIDIHRKATELVYILQNLYNMLLIFLYS